MGFGSQSKVIDELAPGVASKPSAGCIVESNKFSQGWMCKPVPHYPWRPLVELTHSPFAMESSSSSECEIVLDLDRAGPSGAVRVVVSFDTSSEEDPNDPYYLRTPSGRGSH